MHHLSVLLASLVAIPVAAEQIVVEGTLSGGSGDPTNHTISIDQFDTLGDTRVLNFVQLDFLTSTIGGGTTDGSGIPVHLNSQLSSMYSIAGEMIAAPYAVIDYVHPNSSPASFTLFDTDTAGVAYTSPGDLLAWIGSDVITIEAVTQLQVWADPPDIVDFSAGGTVRYTVTFDYSPASTAGDVDGDGDVDLDDLLTVLASWGPCGDCFACPADTDGSCDVDFTDLLAVLNNWTT